MHITHFTHAVRWASNFFDWRKKAQFYQVIFRRFSPYTQFHLKSLGDFDKYDEERKKAQKEVKQGIELWTDLYICEVGAGETCRDVW